MQPDVKDAAYLWDMLDAARAIQKFVLSRSFWVLIRRIKSLDLNLTPFMAANRFPSWRCAVQTIQPDIDCSGAR